MFSPAWPVSLGCKKEPAAGWPRRLVSALNRKPRTEPDFRSSQSRRSWRHLQPSKAAPSSHWSNGDTEKHMAKVWGQREITTAHNIISSFSAFSCVYLMIFLKGFWYKNRESVKKKCKNQWTRRSKLSIDHISTRQLCNKKHTKISRLRDVEAEKTLKKLQVIIYAGSLITTQPSFTPQLITFYHFSLVLFLHSHLSTLLAAVSSLIPLCSFNSNPSQSLPSPPTLPCSLFSGQWSPIGINIIWVYSFY